MTRLTFGLQNPRDVLGERRRLGSGRRRRQNEDRAHPDYRRLKFALRITRTHRCLPASHSKQARSANLGQPTLSNRDSPLLLQVYPQFWPTGYSVQSKNVTNFIDWLARWPTTALIWRRRDEGTERGIDHVPHEANGCDSLAGRGRHGILLAQTQAPAGRGGPAGPCCTAASGRRQHPEPGGHLGWAARTPGQQRDGSLDEGKNFPELNERALAFVKIFDEAIAPKYDLPVHVAAIHDDLTAWRWSSGPTACCSA
jgi:hypothetical protein